MDTHQEASPTLSEWLNPLAGWDAATRWNRATFDWMTRGWQQWVALMTTVPPHFLAPPTVERAEGAKKARVRA